jgi:hypothetical protein
VEDGEAVGDETGVGADVTIKARVGSGAAGSGVVPPVPANAPEVEPGVHVNRPNPTMMQARPSAMAVGASQGRMRCRIESSIGCTLPPRDWLARGPN